MRMWTHGLRRFHSLIGFQTCFPLLDCISSSYGSNMANTTGDTDMLNKTTKLESTSSRVWLSPLPQQEAPSVDSSQATRSRPRRDSACIAVSSKFTVERRLLSSRNRWSLPEFQLQGRSRRLQEIEPGGDQHDAQLPLRALFHRTDPDGS
jgi:hypothetical protein